MITQRKLENVFVFSNFGKFCVFTKFKSFFLKLHEIVLINFAFLCHLKENLILKLQGTQKNDFSSEILLNFVVYAICIIF